MRGDPENMSYGSHCRIRADIAVTFHAFQMANELQMKRCIFTVATSSYQPFVETLFESVRAFNSDVDCFVLVVGTGWDQGTPNAHRYDALHLDEVGLDPEWVRQSSVMYTLFELCNAVKPVAHRIAMLRYKADEWMYLDSDILVMGSLDAVWNENRDAYIMLSPHLTAPFGHDLSADLEAVLLKYGAFNGGAVACRRGGPSVRFVEWFEQRLRYHCFEDLNYQYVDQKWLDLVPSLFEGVHVLKCAGFNVGYWNLDQKKLTYNGDHGILCDEKPLLAYHFSKWNPVDQSSIRGGSCPANFLVAVDLTKRYHTLLLKNGLRQPRGKLSPAPRHKLWRYFYAQSRATETPKTGLLRINPLAIRHASANAAMAFGELVKLLREVIK